MVRHPPEVGNRIGYQPEFDAFHAVSVRRPKRTAGTVQALLPFGSVFLTCSGKS